MTSCGTIDICRRLGQTYIFRLKKKIAGALETSAHTDHSTCYNNLEATTLCSKLKVFDNIVPLTDTVSFF